MEPNDDQWKRLLEVAKKNPEEPTAPPPRSFSGKIDQLRETVQALALTLTWRRWSLLAALLAGLAFLICFYIVRGNESEPTREPMIQADPNATSTTP